MEVGIGLPNAIRGIGGATIVAWARRADASGFSSLATIDRIAFPSYESMVTLAAAAGATGRIRLFSNVLVTPTRDAVMLAKQAASLDQLSGGRLVLGLGVGGRDDDYGVLDRNPRRRGKAFDEMLATMRSVWAGEPPTGTDQPASPPPHDGGRIPMLVGGSSDVTLRRVVEWGIGWTAGGAPPEHVGPFVERVKAAWADAGRSGSPRIAALTYFSVGNEDESRKNLLDYYAFTGDYAEIIASAAPRTPESIRERKRAFEEVGVDELIFDPTVADVEQVDGLADIVL
jgi:alkanesulfonate monooxygenase SsuD/methylene tetrahydromethanopterin reductase-like flavin-dependent oxidoreductase (luciferase family)